MKVKIAWSSLGANKWIPCPPPLTRKPKPCSETVKDPNGEGPLEITIPLQTQSTIWQYMSRPLYSGCEQDTAACEHTWSELASWTLQSVVAKKQNRRSTTSSRVVPSSSNRDTSYGSRTDGPPHPPGWFHLAATETPVIAIGWVNHQQAVGNGRRPAQHHPIPGNMWTEGLAYNSKHGWLTAEAEELSLHMY